MVTERLNAHFGFFYDVEKVLYRGRTAYQQIELVQTPEFGTVLLLDGITQVVEKNEYQYHEPMVHPALCAHPRPRSVCVVGGGDGGIVREVLKYRSVQCVDLVELDGDVVEFSRAYLAGMHKNCFDDPRVQVHIEDGRAFIQRHAACYDAIIMDMTDPFGPSKMLYTREFFRSVKAAMRDDHAQFVMHAESPISRPEIFRRIIATLQAVFPHVTPLYTYIQMYAVLWSIALASRSPTVASVPSGQIDRRLSTRGISGLKLFNGTTLSAMRTAYPYITDLLNKPGAVITDRSPDLHIF